LKKSMIPECPNVAERLRQGAAANPRGVCRQAKVV
jgi:hypothetical protein